MDTIDKLNEFAQNQDFSSKQEFFDSILIDAGIQHIQKMTYSDADRVLLVLDESDASPEFTKSFLASASLQGMPNDVIAYILSSDTDGDGRSLSQEIFTDYTSPFEADSSPSRQIVQQRQQQFDLEL
ncbi:hypothetical protein [Nostoc sp. MG11]|uniref:hypothetical protein n=1 Tax=Nostoc sp. MG11 TaxID=2721166 RepID=UPI001868A168|nr:hypothetical protein [Nostoc sp. MG11]